MSERIVSPLVEVLSAAHRVGFRRSMTGAPAEFRELANALARRSHWRLAAACRELASCVEAIGVSLDLSPGDGRMPLLARADEHGRRAVELASDD